LWAAGALQAFSSPNILWIFSDDHAYQAIGAYGGRLQPFNLTPNIDSIARDGMLFERAYVGNSICAPSRATLLTGKHSHKHGKIDNNNAFNHDQPQFQKVLQKNGYQTAMIGKIHLPGAMQGFDYWEVLPGQGQYNNPIFITEEGRTNYKGHSTDVITDRAISWLKTKRDPTKPFMTMVHYKAAHRHWQPAPRFAEKFRKMTFPEPDSLFDDYSGRGTAAHEQDMSIRTTMRMGVDVKAALPERKAYLETHNPQGDDLVRWKYQAYMQDYLACVAGIDENVGRLLAFLKESGLDENTVVMYSADQGFYLGEHGWFDKRFMYEESYRTPFLVRWPGVTPAGSRNQDLVQNIDFAPTFLDIAGASIPTDMQGVSLVPLLKGQAPEDWRTSLYYHYYEYPAYWHDVRRHEGVSEKRYKLIRFYGKDVPNGEEWELYDLKTDPHEMKSQYANPEYAETIERLKKELARLKDLYEVEEIPFSTFTKKKSNNQQGVK
jgi:arylsulfatase A-like enzyme